MLNKSAITSIRLSTTMIHKLYTYALALLLSASLLSACGTGEHDTPDEDYEKLFPFPGFEHPKASKYGLKIDLCDPFMSLEDFKSPSQQKKDGEHTYEVTFSVMFIERYPNGEPKGFSESESNFKVSYIAENDQLVTYYSRYSEKPPFPRDPEDGDWDKYFEDQEKYDFKHRDLENNHQVTKTFKVKSGYPLMLCVSGDCPSTAVIKASITATEVDGLLTIPVLETEQTCDDSAQGPIAHPYCQTIVLP